MVKTYLNLGKYGDVCCLLTALYDEFKQTREKPNLIISKDFQDIIDGTSYINKIVYDGVFDDINGALGFAKSLSLEPRTTQVVGDSKFIISQVYGKDYHPKIITDSFGKDILRLAGKLETWPNQLPLIFDKRSAKREEKLTKSIPTDKPWVVVGTNGISSPFPWNDLLWLIFRHCLDDFHIIDLNKIKAEKFFDLLGILDHKNTHCNVLIDSGPLHLAFASSKPTHAIIADSPTMWFGAPWRPSYASYTRYKNFPRDVTRILDLIRNPPLKPKHPNIIHVYQRTPWATGEEKRRNEVAAKTWDRIGWVDCGLDDNCFVRNSSNVIPTEKKNIPMIKDMLRMACIGRDDKDVIVLTNTDTCVASNLLKRLVGNLPAYAYRYDFKRLDRPIADDQILLGNKYQGCDLFAMKVGWWRRNHQIFPDMILGREAWDRVMRELFKQSQGRELVGAIYHERHNSFWESASNINDDPSNLRNRMLARKWLLDRKMPLEELELKNYEGKFDKKVKRTTR